MRERISGHPRRALVLAAALAIAALVGDPSNQVHPVAWLGQAATWLERAKPAEPRAQLLFGGLMTGVLVATSASLAAIATRLTARQGRAVRFLIEAVLLKSTLSARGLAEAAEEVQRALEQDDLAGARAGLRGLVSRDTGGLDRELLAAAAIESVAENASDSIVAPALYYLLLGLPGAGAYRAANTLDAMFGYHGAYEYLGKIPARLDDALNLLPARLTAAAIVAGAAGCGGDASSAWRILRRDARYTASPNAGWPMSAMAGALRVQLEKVGHYRLGDRRDRLHPAQISRAVSIVRAATALLLLAAAALEAIFDARRPPS